MDFCRRDLLKYFGIGATITPVIGGQPLIEAASKLLAIPQLDTLTTDSAFPRGHQGINFLDRLKWNPYEAIWLYFWQIENNPPWGINHGIGPLEHILGRDATEEERRAVAGLMQWFGSNCGHAFIIETLEACGYRVTYDRENAQSKQINALQHANVWQLPPTYPIRVRHRGRTVELRYGERGQVLSEGMQ
jgi:hypothetical protein